MLFRKNFQNDNFLKLCSCVISKVEKRRLMLAYRLSMYAQHNNKKNDCLPKCAVKILKKEFYESFNLFNIESLLLDYITINSYMLTSNDIDMLFPAKSYNLLEKLQTFDRITKSRAKITNAKLKSYAEFFSFDVLSIKAATVIAELRSLELSNSKGFPVKIYNRYLPIFDIYTKIGDFVAFELKTWLLQKIKVAQQLPDSDYTLTAGDLYKYFSIVNDKRLQSKKFTSIDFK